MTLLPATAKNLPASPTLSDALLMPFARRIRLLRAWRLGAIGGCGGGAFAVLLTTADGLHLLDAEWWMLALSIGIGIGAGVGYALWEKLPAETVARSVDRRGNFHDQLTTAVAYRDSADPFAQAVQGEAVTEASKVRARVLYPVRMGRWQWGVLGAAVVAALCLVIATTTLFRSAQDKKDAAELKQIAKEVERVAKPLVQEVKRPETPPDAKELAHRLERLTQDLNRARLTKPEALVKANELAEQAKKLESERAKNLQNTIQSTQTAAQQMAKMADKSQLQKSGMSPSSLPNPASGNAPTNAQQAKEQLQANQQQMASLQNDMNALKQKSDALQSQMDKLQKQLESGKNADGSKMSEAQRKAMEQMLKAMQKQMGQLQKQMKQMQEMMKQLQLSKEALENFAKLAQTKEFQEAQKILAKLAQQAQAQQMGEMGKMTPEQMREMAKQLEELAKQLGTEEGRKKYAEALLAAAKAAKELKPGIGPGLMGAFGMGNMPGQGNMGGPKMHGPSGPGDDIRSGPDGPLERSEKSTLLKGKNKTNVVTSQIGDKGPESYTEVLGPATLGARSSIPYGKMLPRYEKSAESTLSRGEIPTRLRGKVRDYFDSLRR